MTDEFESILVVTQYFPPETGASQTRWDELSKRWSEEAAVTVLTSAPDYPEGEIYDGYDNQWLRHEKRDDVDVFYTKTITSPSGDLLRRSLKFFWFMLISMAVGLRYVSPSVVIATSPQPLTGVSAWVIARIKRATFVFEIRDLWPESILAVSDFDNGFVIWLLKRTVTFLYHRADHLIIVVQAFADPLTEADVDESKISYQPNGINPEFYQISNTHTDLLSHNSTDLTVSYVGTIGRAHGLSVILDAAPKLDGVEFLIVGDGAEKETLEQAATNHDNVVFTGRCPKEEVPGILAKSDIALVHLQPNDLFKMALPSKLLESMAAELPVVLGVQGEAERVLTEANAGIVFEPGNGEALATAVRQLRENPDKRREYAVAGREYVAEHFDWDTIARNYLDTILDNPA
ncbi:glycosyltransferase family 4 protein [Halobellus rarus]|uniref:Glycosyltransferase family 4 protein n=1 Tax=Halobellus rarus TaxID=1126237 RepID=A0ABD6CK76_9EURY|nr:glycosyltransferase family 4 protein [Halobellus rarus]